MDDLETIETLIVLCRNKIRIALEAQITIGIERNRADIRRLKRNAYEQYNVLIADVPGIDFDDAVLDREITVKIKLSLYLRIRDIVAQYGIKLPELE